ncbi:unnamed protein product [Arabidopsis lyrata]|nr:unnamed protein product [Arabidopsis lyrata]
MTLLLLCLHTPCKMHLQQVKAHMDSHFAVETHAEKKVEDVMPIATGHEKEELEVELEFKSEEVRVEESSNTATKRKEGGGDVVVAESEELRVEESSNTVEESETEAENEEKTELTIEEDDDDWEGIERGTAHGRHGHCSCQMFPYFSMFLYSLLCNSAFDLLVSWQLILLM